jgi:hypothetical protein
MDERRHMPDPDRLSVVTATVLLAYALTPFVTFPAQSLSLQLPGFFFQIQFDFTTLVSFLVAALAAAGTDWIIQAHPNLGTQARFPHWILPGITAWAIGVPLTTLSVGAEWWAVFALGGVLFTLVLLAEYIVVDPGDTRHGPASVGLIALSFALYLVLAITVRAAGLRLYALLFTLVPTIFLVSLRSLYLRTGGRWFAGWSVAIAMVVGEAAAGFHYWPLTPLRFGLLVLGLSYAITSLAGNLEEGRGWRVLWIEPAIMLSIFWGLALAVNS